MQETVTLPLINVDGRKWILLKQLDQKVVFRATSIEKPRQVSEPNQHRAFESVAEGSVKCAPKRGFPDL